MHGGGLTLAHYEALGRMKGSIEAAVERALKAADADPAIPRDRAARLALLRRGLIPWLAGIDPDTGAPRRRVARLSEIPAEARPLIQHLVEQRLLATDVNKDTGEATIEPAHEALLRQWGLLDGLAHRGCRRCLPCWKASSAPAATGRRTTATALGSRTRRIGSTAAERLSARPDLAASLEPTDRDVHRRLPQGRGGRETRQAALASRDLRFAGCRHRRPGRLDQSGDHRRSVALLDRDMAVHAARRFGPMC